MATCIIFHPIIAPDCAVHKISQLLSKFSRDNVVVIISHGIKLLSQELEERNVNVSQIKRTIYFAHGLKTEEAFSSEGGILLKEWWDIPLPIDEVFAHCCFGADILNKENWNNTFTYWTSSPGVIEMPLDNEYNNAITWLFNNIIDTFLQSNGQGVIDSLQSLYTDSAIFGIEASSKQRSWMALMEDNTFYSNN